MEKLAGKAADRLARARLVASGGRVRYCPKRPLLRKGGRRASGFVRLQSMSGPAGGLPSVRLYGKDPRDRRGRPLFFLRPKENPAASGHKPSGLRAHCLGLHPFPWNKGSAAGKLQQKRKRPARSAERFFRNRTVPGSAAGFYKASEMPRIRIPNSTQAMTR